MRPLMTFELLRFSLLASLGFHYSACTPETLNLGGTGGADGVGGASDNGGGTETGGTPESGGATGTGGSYEFVPQEVGSCTGELPLLEGEDTGFFRCEEGFVERREAMKCPTTFPRGPLEPVNPDPDLNGEAPSKRPGEFTYDDCANDEHCPGDLGYCTIFPQNGAAFGGTHPRLWCMNGCLEDADCRENQLCECGEDIGICVDATCRSKSDCADSALCVGFIVQSLHCGYPYRNTYGCQTANDECYIDATCEERRSDEATTAPFCTRYEEKPAYCDHIASSCGRPFRVIGANRLAAPVEGSDWLLAEPGGKELSSVGLTEQERNALATHYQGLALMEHASIAAFARFSLQLLALGAPAHFIEATNQASIDETHHTRLCFTLASRFAGKAVGAGPLNVEGALLESDALSILRTTIIEGCIGETIASLEASVALDHCEDEQVRAALATIVRDEARHAELAWGVVQWILSERPELSDVARDVFEDERRARSSPFTNVPRAAQSAQVTRLEKFGLLSTDATQAVHRKAFSDVILPCSAKLLATVSPTSTSQPQEQPIPSSIA